MSEFNIVIQSFRDIQTFISTATVQPFQVLVGNEAQLVNAKSFIGMVSLDYSRPLKVLCNGDSDSVKRFCQQVRQFLA
jgi:hypothetical protein